MPAKRVYTTDHVKEGVRAYYALFSLSYDLPFKSVVGNRFFEDLRDPKGKLLKYFMANPQVPIDIVSAFKAFLNLNDEQDYMRSDEYAKFNEPPIIVGSITNTDDVKRVWRQIVNGHTRHILLMDSKVAKDDLEEKIRQELASAIEYGKRNNFTL
jgi:hypothetical protein